VANGSVAGQIGTTYVAHPSHGKAIDSGTLNVYSVAGFPNAGLLTIVTVNGVAVLSYTGLNVGAGQFTGVRVVTGNAA
jgi:hypothetical protein